MLVTSSTKVCAEILLNISHCLLARVDSMKDIRRVYSKGEVFGQCRVWLRTNFPDAELVMTSSTTRAAEIASEEKHAAAIASTLAAQVYDLKVVETSIEDIHSNVTRFLVIGKNFAHRSRDDKTSIMFAVKDRVGSLYEILGVFREHNVNLTMIESRPSRKKAWDYYFFADFQGHTTDRKVKATLRDLDAKCEMVKILGSYPKSPSDLS